jgi:hypothetical protein
MVVFEEINLVDSNILCTFVEEKRKLS